MYNKLRFNNFGKLIEPSITFYYATMEFDRAQLKNSLEHVKKRAQKLTKKAFIPTAIAAPVLLSTAIYIDAALDENPAKRSEEISDFLNNRQMEIASGVVMAAGAAITLNSYYVGRREDERGKHILRVSGPALLTAAAGAALLDAQVAIDYSIPTMLFWTGANTAAVNNSINTFQGTNRKDIRTSSIAATVGISAASATPFLIAADKL